MRNRRITWEFPWIVLVEIDLGDNWDGDLVRRAFPAEIVHHKLLIRRMKPETWR